MSPLLSNLVTSASSIQRQNLDPSRRILAYLLTAYGNAILGQTPVSATVLCAAPATAQSVASKFQGMTEEQFLDMWIYTIANRINTLGVAGASAVTTDGFNLNNIVTASWGGPNGVVDAQVVDALIKFGLLTQCGANLSTILS